MAVKLSEVHLPEESMTVKRVREFRQSFNNGIETAYGFFAQKAEVPAMFERISEKSEINNQCSMARTRLKVPGNLFWRPR